MPLFAKTLQQLASQSLEELSTNTNITRLGPGGKARALLDSVNKRVQEAYDTFDINLARAFLSSAPGQYLDLIGDLLACPREVSYAASVSDDMQIQKFYVSSGTFGNINGGSDIELTRGTIVSSGADSTGVLFRLTSDLLCSASSNTAWASIEATIPGEGANVGGGTLRYHNFVGYSDYTNNSLLTTNIHPIGNGRNFESDANYRYRLSLKVLEAEAANETAIRLAALSTPGVADIVLSQYYRGIGTFGAIIKAVTPTVSQALIDAVTAKIFKVQAFGSLAFVSGPRETGTSFKINIHYGRKLDSSELDIIETAIEETIIAQVNNLDIGATLYLDRLGSMLYTLSEDITNIGETNRLFDEAYLYKTTKLGDNKIRQKLLGDYTPASDERIIIEQSVSNPITLVSYFK